MLPSYVRQISMSREPDVAARDVSDGRFSQMDRHTFPNLYPLDSCHLRFPYHLRR